MTLCIIPARGGSKRIPRKNIKNFCGLPMIAHSIRTAIDSGCFNQIIVSTDDDEIASISEKYGASVPFIRPADLADDYATTGSVIYHALKVLTEHQIYLPNCICCLYATAPFTKANDLKEGLSVLQANHADYTFSVTTFPFPIQRALKSDANGLISMLQPENYLTRSQDLEETWHDAGQFYWGTQTAWLEELPIFNSRTYGIPIPRYRAQDIDNHEDWQRAELMFKILKQQHEDS
ncbi:MAG: pseudaminic acid cytidylyltransferase [Eikenella sp.]|nr:pseudaminic acid cytidylyltransferase [Eikenella sp.]